MLSDKSRAISRDRVSKLLPFLFILFFISGFNALLYQVAWQRMLGLFSGSDVRSATIIVTSYLLGLGVGSFIGGTFGDRLNNRQRVRTYGLCNLAIAAFAVLSRFLFYDLLFLRFNHLADSLPLTLAIVFCSLLIPTTLMGISLPLLSQAISNSTAKAASRIGWLYGINTLGSGLGTLVSGWYLVGTLGYAGTVYLGAASSTLVGILALNLSLQFASIGRKTANSNRRLSVERDSPKEWYFLVFLSGFAAICLEIIWFRVLDIALQSNAYTYAHLLAFVLVSNASGSMLGAKAVKYIRQPRKVFLLIQGLVAAYSAIAVWGISIYWQNHPELRSDIGFINPNNIDGAVLFKYLVVPSVMMVIPNLLLGFYFPIVQQAVQKQRDRIGKRVGYLMLFNILGNTTGGLLTGLVLLDKLGTAGSLRLLALLGLAFVIAISPNWKRLGFTTVLAIVLVIAIIFFPNNNRLWAALQGVEPNAYFIHAEDATSVAAIAETEPNKQGVLLASGQIQANFPYLHIHGLLGSVPALLHPNPTDVMIIGLGSGGTPHTIGVNPDTEYIRIVELLGAELPVLKEYSQTPVGKPLSYLFSDPRYEIIIGDGRRELILADRQFDIIEADAIQPWRSRAGMLYSYEFFQEVRSRLKPGGFFVEWDVGAGTLQTMRSVFPYVTRVGMSGNLWILIASDRSVEFDKNSLLAEFARPKVINFLTKAGFDLARMRRDIKNAKVKMFSHSKDGKPQPLNTDLFPRSEYYLNQLPGEDKN